MLSWVDHLRGESGGKAQTPEIDCLRGLTLLLGGYIEGHEGERSGHTLRTQVLAALAGKGRSCRPSDLADELGRTRPQISMVLRTLIDEELVERDDDSPRADRRVRLYRATAEGKTLAARRAPSSGSEREAG
jgi:DNA-binding MarR family transcriptional regulator